MKIDDIKPGMVVWTYVSKRRVRVRVVRIEETWSWRGQQTQRRVRVERVDNGQLLPKPRTAGALHPTKDFLEAFRPHLHVPGEEEEP